MPVLRIEITSFVRTWNCHSIRKQKNRPHLIYGKPYMNYNYPPEGITNFGIKIDQDFRQGLQDEIQDWSMLKTSSII
jgi:hypothetical protein